MAEMTQAPALEQGRDQPYHTEQNGDAAEAVQFINNSRESIGAPERFDLDRDEPIHPERWNIPDEPDMYTVPAEKPRTYADDLSERFGELTPQQHAQRMRAAGRALTAYRKGYRQQYERAA